VSTIIYSELLKSINFSNLKTPKCGGMYTDTSHSNQSAVEYMSS